MYLDGELPAETFKERIELIAAKYGNDIELYGYNRDVLDPDEMPPLNIENGRAWLLREIEAIKPHLIILDAIMCLLSGSMSEEESWAPVKNLVRQISTRRIAHPAASYWPRHIKRLRHKNPRMGNGHRHALEHRSRSRRPKRDIRVPARFSQITLEISLELQAIRAKDRPVRPSRVHLPRSANQRRETEQRS
jgi:hypothetical protein